MAIAGDAVVEADHHLVHRQALAQIGRGQRCRHLVLTDTGLQGVGSRAQAGLQARADPLGTTQLQRRQRILRAAQMIVSRLGAGQVAVRQDAPLPGQAEGGRLGRAFVPAYRHHVHAVGQLLLGEAARVHGPGDDGASTASDHDVAPCALAGDLDAQLGTAQRPGRVPGLPKDQGIGSGVIEEGVELLEARSVVGCGRLQESGIRRDSPQLYPVVMVVSDARCSRGRGEHLISQSTVAPTLSG